MGFTDDFKAEYAAKREARAERAIANPGIRAKGEQKLSGVDKYLTQPAMPVPTWEYAVINFMDKWADLDEVRRQINLMGSYGWEMCYPRDSGTGLMRSQDSSWWTLIFKRRTS